MDTLRSQVSTEEGRCGPPQTPAPALPEETNNPPDVVPHPVYDYLNTLSRKVPFELTLQGGWVYGWYACNTEGGASNTVTATNVSCVGGSHLC